MKDAQEVLKFVYQNCRKKGETIDEFCRLPHLVFCERADSECKMFYADGLRRGWERAKGKKMFYIKLPIGQEYRGYYWALLFAKDPTDVICEKYPEAVVKLVMAA